MITSKSINFDQTEINAATAAIQEGDFGGNGETIQRYEDRLTEYFGAEHALACSSGTAALYLALAAAGVTHGDEVIVSAMGAVMSALPVLELGAEPVFADVEPDTFMLSPATVGNRLSPRTRAVIAVSMWGYQSVTPELVQFCNDNSITLIEDAAQAHGSVVDGRNLGTLADIACFSTHARKLISTGEGGFVLTNNADLHTELFAQRTLGTSPGSGAFGRRRGMNFKLSGLLGEIGSAQVGKLRGRVDQRNEVSRRWTTALAEIESLTLMERPEIHNGYGYGFLAPGAKRDIDLGLKEANVITTDTLAYQYDVLYRFPVFEQYARFCPNGESLASNLVVVPCHERVTDDVISASCEIITKALTA